jgi:hypothetical protein
MRTVWSNVTQNLKKVGYTAPTYCTHVAPPVSAVSSEHDDFVHFLKQFTKSIP